MQFSRISSIDKLTATANRVIVFKNFRTIGIPVALNPSRDNCTRIDSGTGKKREACANETRYLIPTGSRAHAPGSHAEVAAVREKLRGKMKRF